ncbi:helix-turn-helix domain-containing protein [Prevotella sp.]|uniref:helix-turn-helix domain-containing protein n=1 Tax=Prevotella sp. TaxID=59823 RepID=UPI00307C154B
MTFYSLMSPASGVSKYSTLIREVRGWSSEKVLAMGDTLLQRHEDDKALVMYMLVCSRTNDNMTDKELTDCSLANMKAGDIFYDRGNYINALENYQTGLKLSESSKSKEHLASIYKNIGNAYCMFKDYDKGFEYYKKGYAIIPKGDKELTFKLLANLFGVCLNRKDLKEARKYRQLMQTSPHPETSETHFYITFSKALLTSEEAHYAEANKILIDLAKTSIAAKLPAIFVCSVYSRIYTNYMEMGDMSNALHYIHLCMQTAEKNRMMHYVPETLRDMAEIQKRSGNTSIAQQYDAQYLNLMDSIYNSQRFNVVKNQQFIYEVDKANKEITRLHQEEEIHRHNARLYQLLFLVSIIAVVLISVLLFYVLRQKRNLEVSYRKLYDMNRSNMVETEERKATRTSNMKDDQKQQLLEDIRRVMEETDEYCQQEFTVGSLAKLIGSNERYVSMVINDHYGKSFTELLNDCRIKKACERLTDDTEYANLTITAIGQSVGYKSQTTFIKQFRKCTGLTPSVYQKFVAEDRLNEHTVE